MLKFVPKMLFSDSHSLKKGAHYSHCLLNNVMVHVLSIILAGGLV